MVDTMKGGALSLSNFERLLLCNQYEILERQSPEGSSEAEQYKVLGEIFRRGYTDLYPEALGGMFDEMPPEVASEVVDVLCLHRALVFSLEELGGDKELLQKAKRVGFDGNNEVSHLLYARFQLKELDQFNELTVVNSHRFMLKSHRKMLQTWESFGKKTSLTMKQIEAIMADDPVFP